MTLQTDPWWLYRAQTEHVVDGDTIDVRVDMGFSTERIIRIRLAGVDTAEIYGVSKDSDEYQRGKRHATYVSEFIEQARAEWDGEWPILLSTEKDTTGKYGRYLGRLVRRSDSAVLNQQLREEFDL